MTKYYGHDIIIYAQYPAKDCATDYNADFTGSEGPIFALLQGDYHGILGEGVIRGRRHARRLLHGDLD